MLSSLSRRVGTTSSSSILLPGCRAVARRQYHISSVTRSDALSSHVDTADNTEGTPFDFTEENNKKIKEIIAKYPAGYQRSATIPLLDIAQRQSGGWVPVAAMNKIAKILGTTPMAVYETASFYTMFNRTKIGKFHVQVCTTTPCMLRGSTDIVTACKNHLGIDLGETTKDGNFTLTEVECLGACVNAPMMQIGDHFYEDLTPETTVKVLDQFAKGEEPKVGPQTSRKCAEGPLGKTTLLEPPSGPFCRDL
eukprot:TRINITY_DN2735_c0_g1_i1.p1 TRINITY_DN2735_c0_g1~~TRINITY_DN2735_c0_g1_i1.p1  ORF type:complete len:264 (-),score=72.29 TRINITY_DN2735_c0_g1_i1:24-776(-)